MPLACGCSTWGFPEVALDKLCTLAPREQFACLYLAWSCVLRSHPRSGWREASLHTSTQGQGDACERLTNPGHARSTGWGGGGCSCEEGSRCMNALSSFRAFLLPSCTIHDKNGSNLISEIHVFIRQNKCAITQSFVSKQSCSWLALFLTRVYLFLNNSTFRDLLCMPPLNSYGTFGQLPDRAKTWVRRVRHPGLGHQLPRAHVRMRFP